MNLYDVIPGNLFSLLSSKNKLLYVKALFVLLEIFKRQLIIPKKELISMLTSSLENDIMSTDFSEESLLDNEFSISGKAHFIVRKLKSNGWLMIETEMDFEEYVTLPNYSIKIIKLLSELSNQTVKENFTYVYSTYSSLKTADENREVYEMVTALNEAETRTNQLVESLKSVYHSITYYNQQQIDMISVNKVLSSHYDMFREEIVKKILRPLKVKDSVPKYKRPIEMVLKKWLVDDGIITEMAEYLLASNNYTDLDACKIGDKNEISTRDFIINCDETYIMTLLSLIQGSNKNSEYRVKFDEGITIESGIYEIPMITYRKKENNES